MTVVRNLPNQLILVHAPWVLGGGMIVCIIACAGTGLSLIFAGEVAGLLTLLVGACVPLAIFALAVKRDQAIFDAAAGTVTLQRRTLFGYTRAIYPLDAVRRAVTEDLSETTRPTLTFHDQTRAYPLVEAYTSGNGPAQATRAINDWLRHVRQTKCD